MRLLLLFIGVSVSLLLTGGSAKAASPMITAYKAYLAALGKGDLLSADAQGEIAWREAEKAKNIKYAAVLAYNLAELRMRYLPGMDAVTPAKRAYELAKSTPDSALNVTDAHILSALTTMIKKPTKPTTRALSKSLQQLKDGQYEPNYPIFRAHYELMRAADARGELKTAMQESKAAQATYVSANMDDPVALASVKILYASELLTYTHFKKMEEASTEFQAALDLLGPQPFNKPSYLAQNIRVWEMVANAVHKQNGEPDKKLSLNVPDMIGRPENCPKVQWIKRDAPKYPHVEAVRGYFGAALLHYSLDENGQLHDITVSAEVPQRQFGRLAAQTMKTWRAKPLKGVPVACLVHREVPFTFIFEPVKKRLR
jgi:TonB family protein